MKITIKCFFLPLIIAYVAIFLTSCSKNEELAAGQIEVILNGTPFLSETYLRIPYTLKFWEFEKDGLKLKKITLIDDETKAQLLVINEPEFAFMIKNNSSLTLFLVPENLSDYYLSVQLPIVLGNALPKKVTHHFEFTDTISNKTIYVDGASFTPQYNETPMVISSPVKGNRNVFLSHSTMGYHFYLLFFEGDKIGTCPRFAFDQVEVNDSMTSRYNGDPALNKSYFNYGDTIFSVADGKVYELRDGVIENNGNRMDHLPVSMAGVPGNYVIQDLGNGKFAFYAHCVLGSIAVKVGDNLKTGDPIALLGNSGYSGMPHLHFNIADGSDSFMSTGLPFVFRSCTRVGILGQGPVSPMSVNNIMPEQMSVIAF
jgi:hypothetical protein